MGYVASALVVLSLAMRSVVRLRLISLTGSVVFVVYGVLIDSVPIIVTNTAIAAINVWYLRSELGGRRDLGAVRVPPDSPFLVDFLQFHLDDVRRFQPRFSLPVATDALCLVLMRDGMPAGAMIGRVDGGDLVIDLDYVLRPYRDSRLGHWLYGRGAAVLRAEGIDRVCTMGESDVHRHYLARMGFDRDGDRYVLDVSGR